MSKAKMKEFRNRKVEALKVQQDKTAGAVSQFSTATLYKLYSLEREMATLRRQLSVARNADWRSRAIQKVLEANGIGANQIQPIMEEIQIEDFNYVCADDDKANNLSVSNGVAETGMIAIVGISLFKDGKELLDDRLIRSKVELGKGELHPAIEEAVIGMVPGNAKTIPLNIQDKTDEVAITLYGLRTKPQPVVEQQQA